MNILKLLLVVFVVALVSACGGGSTGDAGTPILGGGSRSGSSVSLFTSAPGSLTVAVGFTTQEYSISGGSPAYTVTSGNSAVASVGVNGSRFIVNGISGGKTIVTVKDAVGASTQVEVAVGSSTSLYTTAPAQISMAVGTTQAYVVSGGAAPYAVTSANGALVAASVSGSGLSLTGVVPGSTTVVVRDAIGTTVSIDATVGSGAAGGPLFTSAASDIVVAPGSTPTYTINGGTGPYTVSTSNAAVVRAVISSVTNLSINGVVIGGAKVIVLDAVGAKVEINVVVGTGATVALYTTAPPTLVVANGVSQSFAIGGGVGPYVVGSSNIVVSPVAVSGSTLSVSGATTGKALISVFDSTGKSITIDVTVSPATAFYLTAPPAISTTIGSTSGFVIGGGAAPYVATSSNISIATVSVTGTGLAINGVAAGSSQVLVRDSTGATIPVDVTVPVGAPLASSAPSSVTIALASAATYTITGGVAPYYVTSSNTSVITAGIVGSSVTLTAGSAGSAIALLRDSTGATSTINVTVGPSTALYTSANSDTTMATGVSTTYLIGGGSGGYSATISNAAVASASVIGNTLTITGVGAGIAKVVVRDAAASTVTINLTVGSPIHLFSSAPAAITLLPAASQSYMIGGGEGPYAVASSNTSIATVSVSASTLTVRGVAAGSASLVISDALGATVAISMTVTPAASIPLAVTPLSATASVGDTLHFTISGGDPAYTVVANNPSIAVVSLSGSSFTALLLNAGATTIAVIDSKGQVQTVALTVTQVQPLLRTSPTSLAVSERYTPSIVFDIYGGVAPYRVFTSDLNLSSVVLSGSGTSAIVGLGSNGSRCVSASLLGYIPPDAGNAKTYGDWSLIFGSYGVVITVIDSVGRSTNAALIIVDNGATCP